MQIANLTKNIVITKNAKIARSFFDQLVGLLNPANPRYLLFRTHFGIHTFGLKLPIDVLVLNHKNKIVGIKQNLKPFRCYFWNPKYGQILEMPSGSIKKYNCQLGDILGFKEE